MESYLSDLGFQAFQHPTVRKAVARLKAKTCTTDFVARNDEYVVLNEYQDASWGAWNVRYNPAALIDTFERWTDDELSAAYVAVCDSAPPYPAGMKSGQSATWAARAVPSLRGAWQVWEVETQLIVSEMRRRREARLRK